MRHKMKEKFGEKVEIKEITNKKGFLKSLLSSKSTIGRDLSNNILYKIEEKLSFNKFGL